MIWIVTGFCAAILIRINANKDGFSTLALKFTIRFGCFIYLPDSAVVLLLYYAFYYEFQRLKNASPSIEAAEPSEAGVPGTIHGLSPCKFLLGAEFAEVNRTLCSVLALKWILKGDYATFTCSQISEKKLSRNSFNQLRDLFLPVAWKTEDLYDLVLLMIISDVGKDGSLSTDRKISIANHDEVIHRAALSGLLPSISKLPSTRKDDVLLGLEFAAKFNVPQFAQAECAPVSLQAAKIMMGRQRAFQLKYLEILLDISGAGAHEDARSAARMIQPVFDTFLNVKIALEEFLTGHFSARDSYNMILRHRGELVREIGFKILSVANMRDRALLRLLAMGRVDDLHLANAFSKGFEGLEDSVSSRLVKALNIDGTEDDEIAVVPYYMPGLIANGLKNTTGDLETVLRLQSLFRLLSKVMDAPISNNDSRSHIIERSVKFAEDTVASDRFKSNPRTLDNLEIPF